jgi:spermidine synthase
MTVRNSRPFLIGIVGAALFGLFASGSVPVKADEVLIQKVESLYNDIYLYRRDDGYYFLTFGAQRLHYVESIVNPKDFLELPVTYTRLMTLAVVYAKGLSDAAMIGLGGARASWYLHKSIPDLHFAAAELDPAIVQIDKQYFGVKDEPNFQINTEDGRIFLTRSSQSFDMILVDAYRGPFVPFHLLTHEFFALAKKHLKEGGVVVQNVEPTTMLFDSAVATISSVFSNLDFYRGDGNIVVVAYDGPRKTPAELHEIAAQRQAKYGFRYDLTKLLGERFDPKIDKSAKALTDDFAPAEYLRAVKRHNAKQN